MTLKVRTRNLKRKPRLLLRQSDCGPSKVAVADQPIDVSPRPCRNCGKKFQPTVQRRLLCAHCFGGLESNHGLGEHGLGMPDLPEG